MPVNLDNFLTGGQINEAGKAAGVTDADLTGGNFTPEARMRLEAEAAAAEAPEVDEADAEGEPTKAELQERADELGIARSGTKAEIAARIAEAEADDAEDPDEDSDDGA